MRHRSSWLAVYAGLATVSALTGCGSSSGPSGPSGPPAPPITGSLVAAFSVSQANPGQSVGFTVTLPQGIPAGSPLVLQLAFDGQAGKPDTLTVPADYGNASGTIDLEPGFPDGTLVLTATLPGQNLTSSASLRVQDTIAPTLSSNLASYGAPFTVLMTANAPMLIAGATDTLAIAASDNGGVAWVGYAIGPPANIRDSIAVRDSLSAWVDVAVPIPTAWVGTTPAVTVFAYDRDANLTTQTLGQATVAAHLTRPVQVAAVDTSVRRAVYDTKRNVVYLAVGDQAAIQVLSLASMTYGARLALPRPAIDLDLRPGGDSLVVTLTHSADLAFLNLATLAPASVVHLNTLNGAGGDTTNLTDTVTYVRVASDGRVLATFGGNYSGYSLPGLLQFVPATATDSIVVPVDYNDNGVTPFLARSGDGTKVVMTPGSDTWGVLEYDGTSHTYIGPQGGVDPDGEGSMDNDGSYGAFGDRLFNSGQSTIGTSDIAANLPGIINVASMVSATGAEFYMSPPTYSAYIRFLEPAAVNGAQSWIIGMPLDVVDTPEPVKEFVQLADTTSLLALGADKAMLFDLTQSSPAPARAVQVPRGTKVRRLVVRRPASPSTGTVVHLHLGTMSRTSTVFPSLPTK
jgi:hypothetical protein